VSKLSSGNLTHEEAIREHIGMAAELLAETRQCAPETFIDYVRVVGKCTDHLISLCVEHLPQARALDEEEREANRGNS